MKYKLREAMAFSCKGKTKQEALNGALDVMNVYLEAASFWSEYETASVQYNKLPNDEGYECILTAFYVRL